MFLMVDINWSNRLKIFVSKGDFCFWCHVYKKANQMVDALVKFGLSMM